jgi:hypothetical protein
MSTATKASNSPVGAVMVGPEMNAPLPFPKRTCTADCGVSMAMSRLPSRLKSETTTCRPPLTGSAAPAVTVPLPFPRSTTPVDTARSRISSPLR